MQPGMLNVLLLVSQSVHGVGSRGDANVGAVEKWPSIFSFLLVHVHYRGLAVCLPCLSGQQGNSFKDKLIIMSLAE